MKQLAIEATVPNIPVVTDFITGELKSADCPTRALAQISVAIDELFGNIAHYAYTPDVGSVCVTVEVAENPTAVIITFTDRGVPYDPLAKADPDVTASAAERQIGGLGIFMTKKMMDELAYEYKDGQNILKIRKNLK